MKAKALQLFFRVYLIFLLKPINAEMKGPTVPTWENNAPALYKTLFDSYSLTLARIIFFSSTISKKIGIVTCVFSTSYKILRSRTRAMLEDPTGTLIRIFTLFWTKLSRTLPKVLWKRTKAHFCCNDTNRDICL